MNETWSLVGVTIVLVILTGWYAVENHRMVKRMDRQREEISRPVLTLQLIPWQPKLLKIRIQNVGNGAAVGINGVIESVRKSELVSTPWSYPLLANGKYEEFGFPVPPSASDEERHGLDEIRSEVIEVKAEIVYESVYGHKYEMKDSIDIKQVTDHWIYSRMMVTQDHPDRILPRIAKALDKLAEKNGR